MNTFFFKTKKVIKQLCLVHSQRYEPKQIYKEVSLL